MSEKVAWCGRRGEVVSHDRGFGLQDFKVLASPRPREFRGALVPAAEKILPAARLLLRQRMDGGTLVPIKRFMAFVSRRSYVRGLGIVDLYC